MKISLTVLSAFGLAAGSLMLAAPAQAITNPADNPRPITVKGDDGRTYTDGEDTLPGYDDVECSYIPGAWYDFDNNRVHYADGQSVSWTEWDRVAGYKSWLAKKNAAPAPGKSSSASKTPATGSASKPAKQSSAQPASKPAATSKSTGSSTPANAGEKAAGSTTPAPALEQPTGTDGEEAAVTTAEEAATAKKDAKETKDAAVKDAAVSQGDEAAAAPEQPAAVEGTFASAERAEAAGDEGSSAAGLLILGALAAGAAALVGGWSLVGRRRKGAQL